MKKIINAGFDGVYLDLVDSFWFYEWFKLQIKHYFCSLIALQNTRYKWKTFKF
jgi:hypothetical protein